MREIVLTLEKNCGCWGLVKKRSREIHLVVPSKKTYEILHKLSTSISDINPKRDEINIISGQSNIHNNVHNFLCPLWKTKVNKKRIDYQKPNKRRSKSNINKLNNQVLGIVLDTCILAKRKQDEILYKIYQAELNHNNQPSINM